MKGMYCSYKAVFYLLTLILQLLRNAFYVALQTFETWHFTFYQWVLPPLFRKWYFDSVLAVERAHARISLFFCLYCLPVFFCSYNSNKHLEFLKSYGDTTPTSVYSQPRTLRLNLKLLDPDFSSILVIAHRQLSFFLTFHSLYKSKYEFMHWFSQRHLSWYSVRV